jgi:hypothetical protein
LASNRALVTGGSRRTSEYLGGCHMVTACVMPSRGNNVATDRKRPKSAFGLGLPRGSCGRFRNDTALCSFCCVFREHGPTGRAGGEPPHASAIRAVFASLRHVSRRRPVPDEHPSRAGARSVHEACEPSGNAIRRLNADTGAMRQLRSSFWLSNAPRPGALARAAGTRATSP